MRYCNRIASVDLPSGQAASLPVQLEVKRRLESGEMLVPCYSLFYMGFSTWLYDALKEAASQVSTMPISEEIPASTISTLTASHSSTTSVPKKTRKRKASSTLDAVEASGRFTQEEREAARANRITRTIQREKKRESALAAQGKEQSEGQTSVSAVSSTMSSRAKRMKDMHDGTSQDHAITDASLSSVDADMYAVPSSSLAVPRNDHDENEASMFQGQGTPHPVLSVEPPTPHFPSHTEQTPLLDSTTVPSKNQELVTTQTNGGGGQDG